MNKTDYENPPYAFSEGRSTLMVRSAHNLTVQNLTLRDSGGDGITLGVDSNNDANTNITIEDVTCDNNYRQGISIISINHLRIDNSTFSNTNGTLPSAGIDIEPNANMPAPVLDNIVVQNSTFKNNDGPQIAVHLSDFTSSPERVLIQFLYDTVIDTEPGSNTPGAVDDGLSVVNVHAGLTNVISFNYMTFDVPDGNHVIYIDDKDENGPRLKVLNSDILESGGDVPIEVDADGGNYSPFGGIDLKQIHFWDDQSQGDFLYGFANPLTITNPAKRVISDLQGAFFFEDPDTANWDLDYDTVSTDVHISLGQNP
jgi:hypothetical protein